MNKLASQIDSLNKHLIGSLHTSYPFGLAHGKMGLLIYLYHLYDYTQEAIYKEKDERLLELSLIHESEQTRRTHVSYAV